MKNDRVYLDHISECISAINQYLLDGRAGSFNDRKTQKAVPRELQEIAESAQRLSPESRSLHPSIPWRDIGGFRNVLVHDYLGLNLPRIWEIIERDLPPLQDAVNSLHRHLPAQD